MPKENPLLPREYWEIHLLLDKLVEEGKMKKTPTTETISGWRYEIIHERSGMDVKIVD